MSGEGLVTNYGEVGGGGGTTKWEGRYVRFYPYEKGGTSFSRAEEGAQLVLG